MIDLLDQDFFTSEEQNIAIEIRQPQLAYPPHTHNFSEIVIIKSGRGRHILNGHVFNLFPGMFFVINEKDCHAYEEVADLHLINVLFKKPNSFQFVKNIDRFLMLIKQNALKSQSHFFIDEKFDTHINLVLKQLQNNPFHNIENQLLYESCFLQLLLLLIENSYTKIGEGSTENRVKQLLIWLNDNYADDINWDSITEKFSLSLRTFHRSLLKLFNITPQKYLMKIRLADASYQLRYTDQSITQIAYRCGFNDSHYFTNCFKKEFNITPKKYKDLIK